jgi:hypothetical protein
MMPGQENAARARETHFVGIPHSTLTLRGVPVMLGPTDHPNVRDRVTELLAVPMNTEAFNPAWSLGP